MTPRVRIDLFSFFFNDTAPTEIYTLSLHDALPILGDSRLAVRCHRGTGSCGDHRRCPRPGGRAARCRHGDRKSTRLNSSHSSISYAVFCLKKKKNIKKHTTTREE